MGDAAKKDNHGWLYRLFNGAVEGASPAQTLSSIHPRVLNFYRRDQLDESALAGLVNPLHGEDALRREDARLGRRAGYAMENVSYWVNQATTVLTGAMGLGAEVGGMSPGGAAARTSQLLRQEMEHSLQKVAAEVGTSAGTTAPATVGQGLMKLRDEAFHIVDFLEKEVTAAGGSIRPTRRGELVDWIMKGLAREAIDKELLPKTLRMAPAPSALTGKGLPTQRIIDFWLPNGQGFDATTATVKTVVQHESYRGLAMPDGTVIRDVMPLVYPAAARPYPVSVPIPVPVPAPRRSPRAVRSALRSLTPLSRTTAEDRDSPAARMAAAVAGIQDRGAAGKRQDAAPPSRTAFGNGPVGARPVNAGFQRAQDSFIQGNRVIRERNAREADAQRAWEQVMRSGGERSAVELRSRMRDNSVRIAAEQQHQIQETIRNAQNHQHGLQHGGFNNHGIPAHGTTAHKTHAAIHTGPPTHVVHTPHPTHAAHPRHNNGTNPFGVGYGGAGAIIQVGGPTIWQPWNIQVWRG